MDKKQTSGYCRSVVLAVLFLVLFCSAMAVAADCPSGCSCLRPADAKEKGYDACGGQLSACGYDIYQKTMYCYKTPLSISLRTLAPLSVVTATTTQPGTCPTGCTCMMESEAKDKFGSYSRCSETPCYTVVTGSAQLKAYCFRQGTTPVPTCPEGCSCISDATAKARGGTWTRCSDTICGYEQSTATLAAVVQVPKYCMKQVSTTPVCPEGCVCITDAMAKERYGDFTRCSAEVCGYELSAATNALSSNQIPKYCIKQASTTPVCPEGCVCITDAMAKERYGTYTRCQADPCGYEMSTLTTAAYQIPKYCVKQGSTPVCPDGCACISDEDAKLKGLTARCDNSQTPCGFRSVAGTANTAATRIPLYCYKIPTTTTTPQVCPQGCYCIQEAEAKLKFGPNNYARCSEKICGNDPSATSANGIPRYCFKPIVTVTPTPQVCPEGCYCLKPEEAKEKFGADNYARCKAEPCSSDQSRYCFKPGVTVTPTPAVCPQGCVCTTDEVAKIKGLTPCRGELKSCGYNSDKQPLYCFEQVPSPTCVYDYQKNACTGTCPEGYTCGLLASKKDATGKVVYAVCGCTGQPTGQCTFDKEKNACAGACKNGGTCAIVGKKTDDKTGEVIVVCGCPQPTSDPCSYDREKQSCTGTCDSGAVCSIIGKKTDDAGNVYVFCGCPQPSSCSYDYSKDACVGTCTKTGDICQLNTIYRDPTTGKVTYAECHCKGSGAETCSCDRTTGTCTGSCADNRACTMVERTTDNAGKVVCSKCECRDTCVLTANNECSGTCPTGEPCARMVSKDDSGKEKVSCVCGGTQPGTPGGVAPSQPGIFEAIASFFNRLFGGK
ncbi:MAG: hypothetical protein LUQ19_02660 [Methanoregula sp.]|nr:hypothetical protein [Methanoregula sp.]